MDSGQSIVEVLSMSKLIIEQPGEPEGHVVSTASALYIGGFMVILLCLVVYKVFQISSGIVNRCFFYSAITSNQVPPVGESLLHLRCRRRPHLGLVRGLTGHASRTASGLSSEESISSPILAN